MSNIMLLNAGHILVPNHAYSEGLKYTGSTTAEYIVGTVYVEPEDQKAYIYALSAETDALESGDPHLLVRTGALTDKWEVEALADDTGQSHAILCVPMADIAASSYGWFQIYGTATVDYDTDNTMTAEAWTAGCELTLTAGKLNSQAASAYGMTSVVASGGAIALAAASGTTDDTTRSIDLIGREALHES